MVQKGCVSVWAKMGNHQGRKLSHILVKGLGGVLELEFLGGEAKFLFMC